MTAKEFFKKHPQAPNCYVVDDQVFHGGAQGSARDFARHRQAKVTEAFNPNFATSAEAVDKTAAQTEATTHGGSGKAASTPAKAKSKGKAGDNADATDETDGDKA